VFVFSLVARDVFSLRGQELVLRWILLTDPYSFLDHTLPWVLPFSMSSSAAVLHHPSPESHLAPSIALILGKRFLSINYVSVHRSYLSHRLVGTSSQLALVAHVEQQHSTACCALPMGLMPSCPPCNTPQTEALLQ
jgi:hypothetical protein